MSMLGIVKVKSAVSAHNNHLHCKFPPLLLVLFAFGSTHRYARSRVYISLYAELLYHASFNVRLAAHVAACTSVCTCA